MDGVQFSPQNYGEQPLLRGGLQQFKLSPGNRIDLLVKAPTEPGTYIMTHKLIGALDELNPDLRQRFLSQRKALAQTAANQDPPLLTVVVTGTPQSMNFPTVAQWPPLPAFLSDITADEIVKTQTAAYSMKGNPGQADNAFFINNKQYDPDCADFTMTLDTAEEWLVTNDSRPNHPFHIHINPFQLMEEGTIINGKPVPFVTYDPPIWQDTQALPSVNTSWDVDAGPIWNNQDATKKCPSVCQNASGGQWNGNWKTTVPGKMSVCGCNYQGDGYFRIRHRFEDFTGEYVQHCHFLGHEDRGMMLNVQTVCPPPNGDQYGKARVGQPECVQGNFTPAAKVCSQ